MGYGMRAHPERQDRLDCQPRRGRGCGWDLGGWSRRGGHINGSHIHPKLSQDNSGRDSRRSARSTSTAIASICHRRCAAASASKSKYPRWFSELSELPQQFAYAERDGPQDRHRFDFEENFTDAIKAPFALADAAPRTTRWSSPAFRTIGAPTAFDDGRRPRTLEDEAIRDAGEQYRSIAHGDASSGRTARRSPSTRSTRSTSSRGRPSRHAAAAASSASGSSPGRGAGSRGEASAGVVQRDDWTTRPRNARRHGHLRKMPPWRNLS